MANTTRDHLLNETRIFNQRKGHDQDNQSTHEKGQTIKEHVNILIPRNKEHHKSMKPSISPQLVRIGCRVRQDIVKVS